MPTEHPFDSAPDSDHVLEALREISRAWLRQHARGKKHFCMERFESSEPNEAWLSIAWDPALRRVEAFCTWVPIWARRGWALDLMRRRPDAPGGVMERLVVRSVEHARERGDDCLSLSLSALVKVPKHPDGAGLAEAVEDPARAFRIERLSRIYDFRGLFRWKRKFDPLFEDRYRVYPSALALPRIAYALVRARSPGGLWSSVHRNAAERAGVAARPSAADGDAA